MLFFISAVKLITEIALLALVGQWVLGLLAGKRKDQNLFYQVLQQMGKPFVQVARLVTPKFVLERHLPSGGVSHSGLHLGGGDADQGEPLFEDRSGAVSMNRSLNRRFVQLQIRAAGAFWPARKRTGTRG